MKEYRVRASSWGTLFDCAYKWEWETLLGNRGLCGSRAWLGTSVHASTAAFDKAKMNGEPITIDNAAQVFIDTFRNPTEEVDWANSDINRSKAEEIGLLAHTLYCAEVSPLYTFCEVEMETKPLTINCGDGITIVLTGTLDRTRVWSTEIGKGISDLKTGKNAVEKGEAKLKGFVAQVGTYELLYEHTKGEALTAPSEIIGLKTSGVIQHATTPIVGAKELLVGTEEEPGLIEYAAMFFRSGLFPPNPSSNLCNPNYCDRWDTCRYHP